MKRRHPFSFLLELPVVLSVIILAGFSTVEAGSQSVYITGQVGKDMMSAVPCTGKTGHQLYYRWARGTHTG